MIRINPINNFNFEAEFNHCTIDGEKIYLRINSPQLDILEISINEKRHNRTLYSYFYILISMVLLAFFATPSLIAIYQVTKKTPSNFGYIQIAYLIGTILVSIFIIRNLKRLYQSPRSNTIKRNQITDITHKKSIIGNLHKLVIRYTNKSGKLRKTIIKINHRTKEDITKIIKAFRQFNYPIT